MKFDSGFVRVVCNTALVLVACAGMPVCAQQQTSAPAQNAQTQSSPQSQSEPRPAAESGQPGSQAQGQAQSQANPAESAQQQKQPAKESQEDKDRKKEEANGVSNDRLFYTLPNFLTISDVNHLPPLSTGEKFKVVARSTFDWVEYPWAGFLAAVSQAQNSEPGYGQGWGAYGKRFGAAFGDGAIENFWTGVILPSALKQDPRFYQSGQGGFWHRTRYAMSRIIVTRTDSGRSTFNASEIFGSGIAAGISTYTYHPRSDRTVSNAASVWGSQIGYDTLTYVTKEFWPDIHRKISRWREREQ